MRALIPAAIPTLVNNDAVIGMPSDGTNITTASIMPAETNGTDALIHAGALLHLSLSLDNTPGFAFVAALVNSLSLIKLFVTSPIMPALAKSSTPSLLSAKVNTNAFSITSFL